MSWSSVIATGSGGTEFRLVIEGLDTEFVTSSALERTTIDGRVRRVGLKRESIELHSGSGIITGKLEASGFSARIVDVDGAATAAFATDATRTTFATLDLSTSGSTLTVVSTSGWPASGVLHAGTECISYVGTTATTFNNLARGFWDTIPQAHYSALTTEQSRRTEITNRPVTIEGRRAYVYAYGDGDDLQGNGTRVFIGIVARDATLSNAVEWTLAIDGMTRILDAELSGPGDGAFSPRGIYYPWTAPLMITLQERASAASSSALNAARNLTIPFCGFFETQDAFCAALESVITAAIAGWANTVSIVSNGDTGWYPVIRTAAANARWLNLYTWSLIDPIFTSTDRDGFEDSLGRVLDVTTFAINTSYKLRPRYELFGLPPVATSGYIEAAGAVPRGVIAPSPAVPTLVGSPSDATNFPGERVYLSGDGSATTTATQMEISTGTFGRGTALPAGAMPFFLDVSQASSSLAYVHVSQPDSVVYPYAGPNAASFTMGRLLTASTGAGNGLADVITWLINNSSTLCNLGGTPLVQSSDFDPDFFDQITEAHRGKTVAVSRAWFAPKKAKLGDYLAEECKLIGVFPALNASGQIKFVPVKLRADTEAPSGTVDASSQLSSVGFPGWERSAMGTINSIVIKTGYNSSADKHEGPTFNPRDVTAFSRSKMPRVLEIAPKSTEQYPLGFDPMPDMMTLASGVLGIFGRPYRVASINVPWSLFSLTPGDLVTITSAQIPNTDGTRGVTQQQGLVLSKRFRANDAHGTIEVLIHGQNIAGYAPFSRITAASGGGTVWTLTLGASTIPGWVDASAFNIGDKVRAMRYDSTTTTNDRAGTITAKTLTTVSVTFASSWTFSGTNHLTFDVSTAIATTSAQARWAFVARSTALINHSGGNTPARTFAP